MSKRDELMKGLSNVRESMGDFDGVVRGAPGAGPRTMPAHLVGVVRSKDVSQIAIDRIDRDPAQPREEFDPEGLEHLAQSLRQRGLLQPIRVRWDAAQERYAIICGERRWRAAKIAGLESLACVIVQGDLTHQERLATQLVENALREDLKPIEQARAYKTLMEAQGWSVRQLAAELSIHHGQVVRAMSLLDLPEVIQEQVEQGTLAPATAYEISKVDDGHLQEELAARVVQQGLSRDETIEEVRATAPQRPGKGKRRGAVRGRKKSVAVRTFRAAGCKVTIENRKGVDTPMAIAALRETLAQLESQLQQEAA
jgi:ParB family transcriptional regulator, chromosome partitioning protein